MTPHVEVGSRVVTITQRALSKKVLRKLLHFWIKWYRIRIYKFCDLIVYNLPSFKLFSFLYQSIII